ncbi:mitochondrial potassium channel ATP-binding subunit-like isoform X2 [Corticium candelabrum]|uniref:mitochondrial potassium channel ATP-binding subunit-like isoform X2 n=1 Tax=Corticium candelabrum TaxID=121492 RepID=UPI002E270AF9|nr:mitochondrial potassium channel ATP-binding subunit-like isoform X2 [Corticium candelabrum]
MTRGLFGKRQFRSVTYQYIMRTFHQYHTRNNKVCYILRKCFYSAVPRAQNVVLSTHKSSLNLLSRVFIGLKSGALYIGAPVGIYYICHYSQHLHLLHRAYCEDSVGVDDSGTLGDDISEELETQQPENIAYADLLDLLWPDIAWLILAIGSAFAAAVVNIKIPILLGKLVNILAHTHGDFREYFETVRVPSLYLIASYLLQSCLTIVYIWMLSRVGERMAMRLRCRLFDAIVKQDISFFDQHRTGELISRLTSDVQDFKSSFKICISQGLRSVTQTIGCFLSLYFISPRLTLMLVGTLPVIVLVGSGIGKVLRQISQKAQDQVAKGAAAATEALGSIRTVRAFAMEDAEIKAYHDEVQKSKELGEKLGFGIAIFQGLARIAVNGVTLLVLFAGGTEVAAGRLTPGDLMSFLVSTQMLQRSLELISLLYGQAVQGTSAGGRVFRFIFLEPTIPVQGGLSLDKVDGNVEFKHVTFSYPNRPGQVVLQDFCLSIPAGKTVALCGPSGAGKSTVAALLERYYDLDEGLVLLDGRDIQHLDPRWLRGHIVGFINQEPVLFATSVMENIRYGKPDASDDEVIQAAKTANCDQFIRDFPQGYDTVVGERGLTVSGGQKQRIAIARALLKDPKILILDEATSALDAESEGTVQAALDTACKDRTVLVIAHRLSTIREADLIAVLSKGSIKELGCHDELLRKGNLYAELVRRQTAESNL